MNNSLRRLSRAVPTLLCLLQLFAYGQSSVPAEDRRWWSDKVEQSLTRAGEKRAQLDQALHNVPIERRAALQFLLENMPEIDLQTLTAAYLLENIHLAYTAWEKAPWRERIPMDVFLNDVLPYASVNEKREAWRQVLHDKASPLVADCRTPAEAAQRLNEKLFPLLNVRYSTQRRRADQGPLETMESGLASCTGLSILLVDACRAVGVPARVVGTPLWANKRGNHTWVEIWDGDWHFVGAAEPDPQGLNRGWFKHDASQAQRDVPEHAIYASSFRQTGLSFPLVWARNVRHVSAINVTDRYAPTSPATDPSRTRLLVKVLDRPAGRRVAAQVTVIDMADTSAKWEGTSRDESADLNDILPFDVPRDRTYEIRATQGSLSVRKEHRPGTNSQEVVLVTLQNAPAHEVPSMFCAAPRPAQSTLKPAEKNSLRAALEAYFVASEDRRAAWQFDRPLTKLLLENEAAVREVAWEAFKEAPIHGELKGDFDALRVRHGEHVSPYTVKTVGTRPANGWALFIAMHGGGGVPKHVNDSQWRHMQVYYRDQPDAGGYLYVALRAPNDTWNGFYDDYVYPLISNLTRQFRLFGDVDPNKVFIMGYSHGGYGAYAIGPKMPDHFAAIHASAAAPTDGETTARTLRNTVFTAMIGEKDTMYGRHDRNLRFRSEVATLRGDRVDIYPVTVKVIEGNGHTGLPDRDWIREMYPAVRNAAPKDLVWAMTDGVIRDFFWVQCGTPGKQREILARCDNNTISLTTSPGIEDVTALFDARLVDFSEPITLVVNGATSTHRLQPSLRTLCETLLHRADPDLAFTARFTVRTVP